MIKRGPKLILKHKKGDNALTDAKISTGKSTGVGFLYFYIHLVTEVICFFMLKRYIGDSIGLYLIALAYDMLAFVPQGVIGHFADRHLRFPLSIVGLGLMAAALVLYNVGSLTVASLVLLCLGNCCTHVNGAEVTLRTSGGRLSPAAIFVSGGSFGVISGKLLGATLMPWWLLLILAASAIPFAYLAGMYLPDEKDTENPSELQKCIGFDHYTKRLGGIVVVLAVAVVAFRGFIGYGIPSSWNKTVWQNVLLYVSMGVGKALGGILSDFIGMRRTAVLSSLLCLPFLLFGDRIMIVSLIGVMLFSMTMSITLALLVSAMPHEPGLAFGLTTLGLFIGTVPVFFVKFASLLSGGIVISAAVLLCAAALYYLCDGRNETK